MQILNRGDTITAVGMKFNDWLKILPPEGSYCLVPVGHVTLQGGTSFPTQGVAIRDLNVRIASRVNDNQWDYAPSRVPANTTLTILGETDDSFYMIPPPPDVVYYVRKDAIRPAAPEADPTASTSDAAPTAPPARPAGPMDPTADLDGPGGGMTVTPVDGPQISDGPEVTPAPDATPDTTPDAAPDVTTDAAPDVTTDAAPDETIVMDPVGGETGTPGDVEDGAIGVDAPEVGEVGEVGGPAGTSLPVPAESSPEAATAFLDLEERYAEVTRRRVEEQDPAELETLRADYLALVDGGELGEADLQMATLRTSGLASRRQALDDYRELRAMREQREAEEADFLRDREEAEARAAAGQVRQFKAVGLIRASVLKLDGRPLYRLTDPENNHTLLYLREGDTPLRPMVGQFVGISGELETAKKGSLSYITPQAVEPVEAAAIYNGVNAEIIPPSLKQRR